MCINIYICTFSYSIDENNNNTNRLLKIIPILYTKISEKTCNFFIIFRNWKKNCAILRQNGATHNTHRANVFIHIYISLYRYVIMYITWIQWMSRRLGFLVRPRKRRHIAFLPEDSHFRPTATPIINYHHNFRAHKKKYFHRAKSARKNFGTK